MKANEAPEQYISKSALVAEIEKRRESNAKEKYFGRMVEDNYFLDFLDTLEVKEVDLEKELIEWHKKHFKKDGTLIKRSRFYLTNNNQLELDKNFFELGMSVSNKVQKGE